jgi:hypothetical protein
MRPEDIEEYLRRFERDIAEAREVLDERPEGFESVAEGKFDLLKDELGDERDRVGDIAPVEVPDGEEEEDDDAFWLRRYATALNTTWLELDVPGVRPGDEMDSRLDAAASHIRFHLLELSRRQLE